MSFGGLDAGDAAALEGSKNLAGARLCDMGAVRSEPLVQVEVGSRIQGVRVARLVEDVGNVHLGGVEPIEQAEIEYITNVDETRERFRSQKARGRKCDQMDLRFVDSEITR